jgi:hypothetical protein
VPLTHSNCALRHECVLRINIAYFPVLTDIIKGGALWFLWGTNRILKCYLDDLTLIYILFLGTVLLLFEASQKKYVGSCVVYLHLPSPGPQLRPMSAHHIQIAAALSSRPFVICYQSTSSKPRAQHTSAQQISARFYAAWKHHLHSIGPLLN